MKKFNTVFIVISIILGVIFGVVLAMLDIDTSYITENMIWIGIFLIISIFLVINIHEFGHYVFGKIGGYKLVSFRIGPLCFTMENDKMKFMFLKTQGYGGLCAMIPPKEQIKQSKHTLYYAGGVLFNFIIGIISILSSVYTNGYVSLFFITFGVISIFVGGINLLPIMSGNNPSDGMIVWSILLKKPFANNLLKMNQVSAELAYGVRPKELNISKYDLNKEVDFTSTYIWLWSYMKALDHKNYEEVDYYMDLLEKNIDKISAVVLPVVYYEICFNSCIKGDIEKAKQNYVNAGKILEKDQDLNGLRIKSYYEYYINKNSLKALEYANKALEVVDKFPIKGQAIMEKELVKELLDKIS